MPIEDGNENEDNTQGGGTTTQAPPEPAINEDRIVQKLFDRLQASQGRPAETQEKSAIVQIYQDLKAKGMDDEFIASQLGVAQNIKNDIIKSVDSRYLGMMQNERNTRAYNYIGRCIREYAKEDPRIGKLEAVIRENVKDKFNANTDRIAEWKQMIVNEDAIEKIVDDVVGDVSKNILGIDKPKEGPAVKTKTSSTRNESDNEESGTRTKNETRSSTSYSVTTPSVDESALNEDQLEFYNTRVTNLQRWSGKSRVEAEKLAFQQAKQLPKYNPRAIR